MSVTFSPVLLPHHQKADGTNFYRIRVTHKRMHRYLKTSICVEQKNLTRGGKVRDTFIIDQVDDLVRRMRRIASEITAAELNAMDIDEVVRFVEARLVKPQEFRLDFVEFGMKVAEKKSPGTASVYRVALNALVRFFSGRHPDISEITVRNLRAFEEFIRAEPVVKVNWRTGEAMKINKTKGTRAPSQYLASLRHIYRAARAEFNDPDLGKFVLPVDPFEYYTVPKIPSSRHRDIPVEVIQKMIDTRSELTDRVRLAIDAFLISFSLMGMNAADMYECAKPRDGILHYCRKKTAGRRDDKAEMYVRIEECVRPILAEYKDSDRAFRYHRIYSNKDTFTTALNQGLKIWCRRYGQEPFTFYSARHSWATIGHGKRCNIPMVLISAGLCHVPASNNTDQVYVRLDWEQVWDANAKILSLFDWE